MAEEHGPEKETARLSHCQAIPVSLLAGKRIPCRRNPSSVQPPLVLYKLPEVAISYGAATGKDVLKPVLYSFEFLGLSWSLHVSLQPLLLVFRSLPLLHVVAGAAAALFVVSLKFQ
ncbi:hypothetical protein PIB30_029564 [Stylosanthes scabra]|uniref:Uncharacterized protein n=1 Tax=Stylosanthes scabra TaxID=79078 RepID=A0ABU6X8W2_9FABA|nr:hypothetical protein [Stylosanthes scabra]